MICAIAITISGVQDARDSLSASAPAVAVVLMVMIRDSMHSRRTRFAIRMNDRALQRR